MDADTELVMDALFDRRQGNRQSCFVTNQAGLLLLQSPASILPVIERVLRDTVAPVLSGKQRNRSYDPTLARLLGDFAELGTKSVFLGLDYVLGAYLVVGAKFDFPRVAEFLPTLSEGLLLDAISAVPVFFKRMEDGFNFGVSPEGEVMDFLLSLSRSEREDVRLAAARVVEQIALAQTPCG